MTYQLKEPKKPSLLRLKVQAVVLGSLLAVLCRAVPQEYQAACETVAEIAAFTCGG